MMSTVRSGAPSRPTRTGAARVAVGETFTPSQQRHVEQSLTTAMRETSLHFSVFVGDVDGEAREVAERLHAALGPRAPPRSWSAGLAPRTALSTSSGPANHTGSPSNGRPGR